jgi:molybdopterin converting factor small subunit
MADIRLPPTLTPLFAGLPRRVEIDADTPGAAIAELDRRLCHPGPELRHHIRVYVDGEPAELDTPLAAASRLDVIAAISGG